MKILRRVGRFCAVLLLLVSVASSLTFYLLWRRTEKTLAAYAAAEETYDRAKLSEGLRVFAEHALIGPPSRDVLTDELLRGVVSAWGDPYAAYYDAEEYAAYLTGLDGSLCGIGVAILRVGTGLCVLDVFPDSPAEAAGLAPGDVITSVDGRTMADVGYDAFLASIRGAAGTTVSLVWTREGEAAPRSADLTRARVAKRTVLTRSVPGYDRIAYIRITGFDGLTYAAFKAAVDEAEAAGKEAFIFDLRGNGGGTLDAVCRVLSYVLPDGDIVTVDYAAPTSADYTIRAEGGTYYNGARGSAFPDAAHALTCPVAVLCDAGTASAAELFTAALRDYAAAGDMDVTTVGAVTFGKGTVQTSYPFSDGSALKMTIATYAPPCGVNYDGVGITPDLAVALAADAPDLYLRDYAEDAQWQAAAALLSAKLD